MKYKGLELILFGLLFTIVPTGCSSEDEGASGTENSCGDVDCGSHGECITRAGDAECDCDDGYRDRGLTCVKIGETAGVCQKVDCSGHGQCVEKSGEPSCVCDEGFEAVGLTCVDTTPGDTCAGVTCSYHGECVEYEGSAVCQCDGGYHAEGLHCIEDTTEPGAPVILSFLANNPVMDETGQLVLTAVVTDPDGIDDVIGGQLDDPVSQGGYGAFITSAAEGSYSITLSWGEIQQVRAINTAMGGETRSFRASFYDQAGRKVSDTVKISLQCRTDGELGLCEGICEDLDNSVEHCGSCFNEVVWEGASCQNGQISCPPGMSPCNNVCVDLNSSLDHCGTCNNKVLWVGGHCDRGQITCGPGKSLCGNICVDLNTNEDHCGTCNNPVLWQGGYCDGGQKTCADGWEPCDDVCVNLQTSRQHCGECDNAVVAQGAYCDDGQITCGGGRGQCDGVCVDLLSNRAHCGSCDTAIYDRDASCQNGEVICPAGEEFCNGYCYDLTNRSEHCGACNRSCHNFPLNDGSDAFCRDSKCVFTAVFETVDNCENLCVSVGLKCARHGVGSCGGYSWSLMVACARFYNRWDPDDAYYGRYGECTDVVHEPPERTTS